MRLANPTVTHYLYCDTSGSTGPLWHYSDDGVSESCTSRIPRGPRVDGGIVGTESAELERERREKLEGYRPCRRCRNGLRRQT